MIDFLGLQRRIESEVDSFVGTEFYKSLVADQLFFLQCGPQSYGNFNGNVALIFGEDKPDDYISIFKKRFKKVFSVNSNDHDVQSLPLGILDKMFINKFSNYAMICEARKSSIIPNRRSYSNFTTKPERTYCIQYLQTNLRDSKTDLVEINQCQEKWLVNSSRERYKEYYHNAMSSKFIFCPQGQGLDTYRFWEILYLGRIPVVVHNAVVDAFNELPVLVLDRWEDFEEKAEQFENEFSLDKYNFQSLTRDYWIDCFYE